MIDARIAGRLGIGLGISLSLVGGARGQCPADDAYEDNDTCPTAVTAPAGVTTGLLLHGLASGMDPDVFEFTVLPEETVTVTVDFVSANGNIDLQMIDATVNCSGPQLGSSTGLGDSESITWFNNLGTTRTVVFGVIPIGATFGCSEYTLTVDVVSPPCPGADAWEPNFACSSAVFLPLGQHSQLSLFGPASPGGTEGDFYQFWLHAGAELVLDLSFAYAGGEINIDLYDVTGGCGVGAQVASSVSVAGLATLTYRNPTGASMLCLAEVLPVGPLFRCCEYDLDVQYYAGDFGVIFCVADPAGPPCPCSNWADEGKIEGCRNATGSGAYLSATGTPSCSNDQLVLTVNQVAPWEYGIFIQNVAHSPVHLYLDGQLCLTPDIGFGRHYAPPLVLPTVADGFGSGVNAQPMTVGDFRNNTVPGATIYYQYWYRDPGGACGQGASFSSGIGVTWGP